MSRNYLLIAPRHDGQPMFVEATTLGADFSKVFALSSAQTVTGHAIRGARTNPIQALRYE
ncbi:MAG: hypothetical protein EOP58_00820 [Sphingomonadales bacterium]|nr:MAG: hypothetical protein EOP58_00820 [Sphingomonadales bacterium]